MKLGHQELLHHHGNYLVRRLRLAPGEATPWHRDPFHRVTVVLRGDVLDIEFRDGGETQAWNVGKETFEEVTTFFLDHPEAVPQPEEESE